MAEQDDSGKAPEPVQIRFRALSADGRKSPSVELQLERAQPPPPRLAPPFFGHTEYRPGDKARIVVNATGVQHGEVKLFVEKQAGSAWQPAAELSASFDHGAAWAAWTVPPEEGSAPVQYRVRAVAPFGEQPSEPVTVQRDTKGELTDASFSHAHPSRGAHFDDGDEAVLRVVAKGLDGRQVRFVVEQQQGSNWAPLETLTATVAKGEATARLTLHHPVLAKTPKLADLTSAKGIQIRFHAELV
jgi:hypothetical protein